MSETTERNEMSQDRAPRRGRPPARREEGRATRIPLGKPHMKLTVPQAHDDKDHVYRWINDTIGRLNNAVNGGWEFVEDTTMSVGDSSNNGNADIDSRVKRVVGKDERGKPMYGFLMRIKKEWYDEDQAAKQYAIEDKEKSIKRGTYNATPDDNRYIPKEGIRIR